MDHFSQVGVLEVFLEAAPTTFLLVILIVTGLNSYGEDGLKQILIGNGEGWDVALFIITCASSIFSFTFGVSRYELNKYEYHNVLIHAPLTLRTDSKSNVNISDCCCLGSAAPSSPQVPWRGCWVAGSSQHLLQLFSQGWQRLVF